MNSRVASLILGSAFLVACGDGSQNVPEMPVDAPPAASTVIAKPDAPKAASTHQITSMYLASAKDLPACDVSRKTMLAYLADAKEFQSCDGSAWKVVQVLPAAPVPDRIVERETCRKDDGTREVAYTLLRHASGDVAVSCSIVDSAGERTGNAYYAKSELSANGGATAPDCRVELVGQGYYLFFRQDEHLKRVVPRGGAPTFSGGGSVDYADTCTKTVLP